MSFFEEIRGQFVISTDKQRLNLDVISDFLRHRSYWARDRSRETIAQSIENSLCFGVFDGDQQVGFARVVTDYATFGRIADVFILESHRKKGLSKWLVQCIIGHPEVAKLRRVILATEDAHDLYRKYAGFEALPLPERWMTRIRESA
jgi:GNAT superfamily N-acetyltransferase